jgi:hypothetical protein
MRRCGCQRWGWDPTRDRGPVKSCPGRPKWPSGGRRSGAQDLPRHRRQDDPCGGHVRTGSHRTDEDVFSPDSAAEPCRVIRRQIRGERPPPRGRAVRPGYLRPMVVAGAADRHKPLASFDRSPRRGACGRLRRRFGWRLTASVSTDDATWAMSDGSREVERSGGRGWNRTIDPPRVKRVLYR